jgi:hypothetical protein
MIALDAAQLQALWISGVKAPGWKASHTPHAMKSASAAIFSFRAMDVGVPEAQAGSTFPGST